MPWRSQHRQHTLRTLGGFCLLAQLLQLTSWCGLRLCHQRVAVGPLLTQS